MMSSGWRGHANFGQARPVQYSPRRNYPYHDDDFSLQLSPTPVRKPEPEPKPAKRVIMILSQVHWCEANGVEDGHAFSSKDPNKERIVRSKETDKLDPYGAKITEDEEYYLCGEHSKGLFRRNAETSPKPITGTPMAQTVPGTVAD